MKLKDFRRQTAIPVNNSVDAINVSRSGRISITKSMSDKMALSTDHTLALLQDEESPADWYISYNYEWGAPIRVAENKDSGNRYSANNKHAACSILDHFGHKGKSYVFNIDTDNPTEIDGVTYYKLFTKQLEIKQRDEKPYEFNKR